MPNMRSDKPAKVIIQFADGRMVDLFAHVVEIAQSYPEVEITVTGESIRKYIPIPGEYSVTLRGIGDITETHEETQEKLSAIKNASEWQCPYCSRPNQRRDETCKSCGGVRPFLYD